MTNKLLERPLRAAIVMLLLGSQFVPTLSMANAGYNDTRFLHEKAELLMARATGAQAQQAAIAARDAAALSSAECVSIEEAARLAAMAFVDRGQPVSPEKFPQLTTCFVDVFMQQVPISLTGIGFIDGFIRGFATSLLSSACNKATAFVSDLKNSAINQLKSGVTGSLKMSSLSIAGVNVSGAVNNTVGTAVNNTVNNVSTNVITNVTNSVGQAGTNLFINGSGQTSTNLFQSSGTPTGF